MKKLIAKILLADILLIAWVICLMVVIRYIRPFTKETALELAVLALSLAGMFWFYGHIIHKIRGWMFRNFNR